MWCGIHSSHSGTAQAAVMSSPALLAGSPAPLEILRAPPNLPHKFPCCLNYPELVSFARNSESWWVEHVSVVFCLLIGLYYANVW